MIKKNLKTMVITTIIILVPLIVGLLMWNQLPDTMATHFDENGVANGWSSKPFAVIGIPLILVVIHWFCAFFTGVDPKKSNISDKMMTLVLWIVPVTSIFACGSMYVYAFDNTINTTIIGMMLIGCIFLVLGNYMPKMKQSYTLGIKLPWTLESEENWNRTHRLGGWVYMACGILVLIAGFTQQFWMVFVVIVLGTLIPVAYSYSLYKKGV